jgi:hypothetical protein
VLAPKAAPNALATFHYHDTTSIVPSGTTVADEISRERNWRHITIEADLPFDVVGFFAKYANALASAKIPILPFASYKFDHVLVPADRIDEAVAAMQTVD